MLKCLHTWPQGEVWLCDLTFAPDAKGLATLSKGELARAERFVQSDTRQQFLAAHVALRYLLSTKTGQPAASMSLMEGHLGKPYVESDLPCYFNLSHSANVALIALSSFCEIGVDIEVVTEINDIQELTELAQQYFSIEELSQWSSLPATMRMAAFYQIWTRKEACTKATGWGLHLPLPEINVGLDPLPNQIGFALPNNITTTVTIQTLQTGIGSIGAVAWVSEAMVQP